MYISYFGTAIINKGSSFFHIDTPCYWNGSCVIGAVRLTFNWHSHDERMFVNAGLVVLLSETIVHFFPVFIRPVKCTLRSVWKLILIQLIQLMSSEGAAVRFLQRKGLILHRENIRAMSTLSIAVCKAWGKWQSQRLRLQKMITLTRLRAHYILNIFVVNRFRVLYFTVCYLKIKT
jgi:hypothetical protein